MDSSLHDLAEDWAMVINLSFKFPRIGITIIVADAFGKVPSLSLAMINKYEDYF